MEMIGHEYESQEVHPVNVEGTFQKRKELPPVVICKENGLSSITPAGDMITCILKLDAKRAAHR